MSVKIELFRTDKFDACVTHVSFDSCNSCKQLMFDRLPAVYMSSMCHKFRSFDILELKGHVNLEIFGLVHLNHAAGFLHSNSGVKMS